MEPKISYIICATPRSGSHLLCEALKNTKLAGIPDEYFITHEGKLPNETEHIIKRYGKKTLEEFRQLVFEVGSTPNGAFGISILRGDIPHILNNYRELPQYRELTDPQLMNVLFNNPKYIWLTRQDKVRQAVSLAKAVQTDVWRQSTHEQFERKQEPVFDFHSIDFRYNRLVEDDLEWSQFFAQQNITPFKVVYEELVNNYEQTAVAILDYLNISHPEKIEFGERRLQKQADRLSEEWVARYNETKQYHQSRQTGLPNIAQYKFKLQERIRRITVRRWLKQLFRRG
ncbi:MAG: sulfotransferase domain-containing protein [Ardenticatenaceae bacterium]|nr:sulfotransferase domain-containing protein [Ardenticatenaceae bacterium]